MSHPDSDKGPVTFQDVAAYFSEKEWKLLHEWQKELYKNVMKDIHQALASLGPLIATSVFSLNSKGKELYFMDQDESEGRHTINQNPSDMFPSADTLFRTTQGENHLMDSQDTDRKESSSGIYPEFLSFTSNNPLIMDQELEDSFMHTSYGDGEESSTDPQEGGLVITQVASLTIKKDDDDADYFADYRDSERCVRASIPTEDPVTKSDHTEDMINEEVKLFKKEPGAQKRSTEDRSERDGMNMKVSHICHKCKKKFNDSTLFQQHQTVHAEERLFHCTESEKSFTNKTALHHHQKMHRGLKPFTCNECEKSFTQKKALQYHQRSHTGEKPYACDCCIKTFAQKTDLQRHLRIHTGEKPFACTKCERRFSQKICLVQHLKIHLDQKPFPCTECNMRFTQKRNLINHFRIHTGERPFSCSECNKSFTNKGHLVRHQVIHKGVRPFPCSECEKSFTQKTDLQRHQRIHTGMRPFHCTECEKSFTLKGVLRRHQKIHKKVST